MTTSSLDMSSETGPALPPIVPGKLILNGENPFIRLSDCTGRSVHYRRQPLDDHLFPRGRRPRPVHQERTDGRRLAHLLRQFRKWCAGCRQPCRAC